MLNLDLFRAQPLVTEPFKYVVVRNFLSSFDAACVREDFPVTAGRGLFPLSETTYGPRFAALIEEMNSPEFESAVSEKFGLALSGRPLMITVRGRCNAEDGRIHTDSRTKVVSGLLYFNGRWFSPGGRLRMLTGPDDIEAYCAEVAPHDGTLVAFVRSENSFHGHLPYEGVRRCLQFNWMRDAGVMNHELRRHRWSARMKRMTSNLLNVV